MSCDHFGLKTSFGLLTTKLVGHVMRMDWNAPEDLQQADRMMRILSALGRNIEKCIAMSEDTHTRDTTTENEAAEAERLRRILYDQLVRYADRLGEDELARRLELDRAEAGSERVELLGPEGPVSS